LDYSDLPFKNTLNRDGIGNGKKCQEKLTSKKRQKPMTDNP
jgi:hypothetical protein